MFSDRTDAGNRLAEQLQHLRGENVIVVGLPRGGVPVAHQVAVALDAPLDVILVRKLGVPYQPELAMGAIGEGGIRVLNDIVIERAGIDEEALALAEQRERVELDRRIRTYRGTRKPIPLAGRHVIVVDDGIATGATARAACQVARKAGASRITLAVPVAPVDWIDRMSDVADELVAVVTPREFYGIGQFYRDFSQTTDAEVVERLTDPVQAAPVTPNPGPRPMLFDADVEVDAGNVRLHGHLSIPDRARGVVIFAHGAGSSRHSPRNRYVASVLNDAGLATLLFDLLTEPEELDRANVFDIGLLADRLVQVTTWVQDHPDLAVLAVGYFGASTGAAAALSAAASRPDDVAAVVSRGGRPDLTTAPLSEITSPTLLIVGGDDHLVLGLNRDVAARLQCPKRLHIIPGATHLFEEPGTLPAAAVEAREWFLTHLATGERRGPQPESDLSIPGRRP